MCSRSREALLRAAAALISREDCTPGPFTVTVVDCDGVSVSIPCKSWVRATAPAPAPDERRGKWLSHLESRIVEHLHSQGEFLSGESIAQALDEPYQHRFKAILTNLCDREILEGVTGSGYRIAPG